MVDTKSMLGSADWKSIIGRAKRANVIVDGTTSRNAIPRMINPVPRVTKRASWYVAAILRSIAWPIQMAKA